MSLAATETASTPSKTKWDGVIGITSIHIGALLAPFFFTWEAFWVALVLHWVTGSLGICLCYHRLLTHQSLTLWKPLTYLFAFFGCLAWQGGPTKWVAVHRMHHARADKPNDPHSPLKSFWWAHIGWLFSYNPEQDEYENYRELAPDVDRDPILNFLNATHGWWNIGVGVLLLLWGGLPFLMWGFFFRTVFLWHCTWFVNSAAHVFGYRTWATEDQSTNCWWVALLSYGEGWHNNHHAFMRSAAHGLRAWEIDPTYLTIRLLSFFKLADKIQLPKPELQQKLSKSQGKAAAA